ncbi:MAG: T9SS type A sorting domain-containing protein, partial [Ignavibacteria bacterium]|nr:T9SS type A sorting domain-containing protein [Ignavibacteria bacterium]
GWVAKSTDKGITFPQVISAYSFNGGLGDKPWITAVQTGGPYSNYLYVGWRQFGASGMRFVRSTNGGLNWSSPYTLLGSQGAYVCYGANGSIQAGNTYFGCISGSNILVYRSSDGGETFGAPVIAVGGIVGPGTSCAGRNTVKNCIRTDYFPRMAADNSYTPSRGNVYVVYAAKPGGGDLANIYMARSTDFGATWSTPLKVNDDATTTDQWMPAITIDKISGRIFVLWYDSRNDPAGNLLTELWGTHSTNGGVSFVPNYKVSNAQMNPNTMAVGQPGGENYMGDYIGNSSVTSSTSLNSFMDGRLQSAGNNMGSYAAYGPDFAMKSNLSQKYLNNNDSFTVVITVPAVKGGFNERIKFTALLDSLPQSGNISVNFQGGKDSITSVPDSVKINVKLTGSVSPKLYKLNITGSGITGIPIHRRTVDLIVNSSFVTVGTNRNTICDFKINGVQYTTTQNILYANGSTVTVQALSPKITGGTKYIYKNWSDNGDTTHNITVTNPVSITANYRTAYKLVIVSSIGNTFGGDIFYDSAVSLQFGVTGKIRNYNGQNYLFRGWTGSGTGSYTSPDSTGNDTIITISLKNAILQTARWIPLVGISNNGAEIPAEWRLYQNYPNPFNPVTKIEFDVIKTGMVKIAVYDILGKEVEILANEVLQPGKYKTDFDASKLSSGVYFYRITANEFTDIKRMMVIK